MFSSLPSDISDVFGEWYEPANIGSMGDDPYASNGGSSTRRGAFWRTICGDTVYDPSQTSDHDFRRATLEDERAYEAWCHFSESSPFKDAQASLGTSDEAPNLWWNRLCHQNNNYPPQTFHYE